MITEIGCAIEDLETAISIGSLFRCHEDGYPAKRNHLVWVCSSRTVKRAKRPLVMRSVHPRMVTSPESSSRHLVTTSLLGLTSRSETSESLKLSMFDHLLADIAPFTSFRNCNRKLQMSSALSEIGLCRGKIRVHGHTRATAPGGRGEYFSVCCSEDVIVCNSSGFNNDDSFHRSSNHLRKVISCSL